MCEVEVSDKKDEKLELVLLQIVGSVIGVKNENKVISWREKGLQLISEGKVVVLFFVGG